MKDMGFIRVACASLRLRIGNPRFNASEIEKAITFASENGAAILLTPEMSLCGYTCGDLFGSTVLTDECASALESILSFCEGNETAVCVGMPLAVGSGLFNTAVMIKGGRILGVTAKEYLANSGEFYEKRWFASLSSATETEVTLCGQTVPFGRPIYDFGNVKCGVEICQDLWVPAPPSTFMALSGAELILNPSASDESVAKNDYRRSLVASQSAKCVCGYAFASAGVNESTTDLVYGGSSYIAENGVVLAEGERFSRDGSVIFACIDIEKLRERRFADTTFAENASAYGRKYTVVKSSLPPLEEKFFDRKTDRFPFVPSDGLLRRARCEEILNIQTAGLAGRISHIGSQKLIVGVSGGLDSTLALLVAARTAKLLGMPESAVIGITMPGFGTTGRTYNNALGLISALGAEKREISIKEACLLHFRDIGHDPEIHDVTYENVQARERTQILMDIANKERGLLIGTGDLSELALGWCTYNGDHMSMYGVNCGVPKTLVRYIIGYLAETGDERIKPLLLDILDTPVSPELLPPDENGVIAQKTEDTIGPYELHDFFLYHFLRTGASRRKIAFLAENAFEGVYDRAEIEKWLSNFIKRFFASQFKRSCLPDGPKVGTVSLSPRGDLRMPSDADCEIWLNPSQRQQKSSAEL